MNVEVMGLGLGIFVSNFQYCVFAVNQQLNIVPFLHMDHKRTKKVLCF
jgi:hypothetical protein